jgi:hypothetical protein
MSLQDVITQIRNREGNPDEDWLLIAGEAEDLALETDCALAMIEIDEDSDDLDEIIPAELRERGPWTTIRL